VIGKIAKAAGIAFATLLVAAVIGTFTLLMGPLPARRGRVVIPQVSAPVEARFDARGIPHVRSVLEVDAWRALGFIHATDRLFQMELRRRAAAGRLAELFGPEAVALDREARVNGYAAAARRDWEALPENSRAALTAYADGVNAFLVDCSLPLELRALSLTPEPWTPLDSLAFARLMQDGLSVAPYPERSAFDDARARGLDAALALADAAEPGSTHVSPELVAFWPGMTTARASAALPETAPVGSNAWALAGTRTASGKPLLAGDPHLAAERPGVWYAAHLTSADGLDAAGLTLPGVPGILIGHNGRVAWSMTMHQADDSDFYVEQVDWSAGRYRRGDAWVPLERATETIHVKGGADVTIEVGRTIHGPIVLRSDDGSGWALSQAFAPANAPQGPEAFLDAARARNGTELLAAFSRYAGPSVNVCWADVTGAVGVKVAGSIPRRRSGNGRFPVPGWDAAYDWDGTIAPAELPAMSTPPDGIVVTANDDWSASSRVLPYPGIFAESDRAIRARELGTRLDKARVADMRAMQNDIFSPYAARVVASLNTLVLSDPKAVAARAILARWDAKAETTGPSRLFYAFMKEVRKDAGGGTLRVTWSMLDRMIEGQGAQEFWDDPATSQVETRASRVEAALARALTAVEREGGSVAAHWSWGKAHRLTYPHAFASVMWPALARRLAFGPVALPGESHTLDVAGFPLRGDRYDVSDIPSARFIVDLGSPDDSRLVLPLGQSGQLFDRHGHDQLQAWANGRDFALPFSAKAVEAATISTLRFVASD